MNEKIKDEVKKITIARFETLNPDSKILLLGENDQKNVREIIDNVEKETDFGKKVMEVQYRYLRMLLNGEI